jgi:hypothetical protein
MSDAVEIGLRVTAGLDFLRTGGGEELREHYIWVLKQVMGHIKPEDLSTATLVSMLAVLIPEHSRFIGGGNPAVREATVLRLLPRDDNTAG